MAEKSEFVQAIESLSTYHKQVVDDKYRMFLDCIDEANDKERFESLCIKLAEIRKEISEIPTKHERLCVEMDVQPNFVYR